MKLISLIIVTISTVYMTTMIVSAKQTTTTQTYVYQTNDGTCSLDKEVTQVKTISEKIPDDIVFKMLDDKIDSYPDLDDDVNLAVHNGRVILTGTVDNIAERDHAAMIARSIPGVTEVDNLLVLESRE